MHAAPARGGRRAALVRQSLAIACVVTLLVAARLASEAGRVALPGTSVVRVAGGPEALEVWRDAGVRGRTLVHMARRIAMRVAPGEDVPDELSEANYLYVALRENLIRRVYHVIPDVEWPEIERSLREFPSAARTEAGFRLEMEGAPVVVVRARDLPTLREPVLVNVEMDRWSAEQLRGVYARLGAAARPDLVTWWAAYAAARGPEEVLRASAR